MNREFCLLDKLLKYFGFFLVVSALSACGETKIVESGDYVWEIEPNGTLSQAMEIEEGNTYAAEIAVPAGNTEDSDLYKVWFPSGTLVTFEFESDAEDFEPYIGHTDSLGNSSFAVFETQGRHKATFVMTATGWQYFEIGDRRNVSDGTKFGGFRYYFRFLSKHLCNGKNYDKIKSDSVLERVFSQKGNHVDILEVELPANGFYQFNVETENMLSDKFSFIMNCGSREIVAGNDDEDYYSNKIDPLIYTRLEKNLRHLFVTGRILLDLSETQDEKFRISMKKQPESSELEPNDTYDYANIIDSAKVSGYLDKLQKNIVGVIGDDEDWFRFEVEKGEIFSVKITPESANPFAAEMWATSYGITGNGFVPMRASMLSGIETHTMNILVPFNGQIYFDLIGNDVPYSFEISRAGGLEAFDSEKGELETELPDCAWKFYKWNFTGENNFAEIALSLPENLAGLYIFDRNYFPYAIPDPSEITRFFVRRYEITESLVFGLSIGNCEQNSGEKLTLSVTESENQPEKWTYGIEKNPIKIETGGAYQGFFDTDVGFYENFFEFTAEKDGTVYIMTSPDRESTASDINTVVTLMQNDAEIAVSDDMIETIAFNKYSFIAHKVKKGGKYTIKVAPFMTESSNVSAMNIKASYILDLYLK